MRNPNPNAEKVLDFLLSSNVLNCGSGLLSASVSSIFCGGKTPDFFITKNDYTYDCKTNLPPKHQPKTLIL